MKDHKQFLRNEAAAIFVAIFLASIFFTNQGLYKALLLLLAVFLMFQPFILYSYFRSKH